MMKSLKIIQMLSKIGMIISKIVYICCIIGAMSCAVGMAGMYFADAYAFKVGGVSLRALLVSNAGVDPAGLYPAITGVMILCIGQAVLAKFAVSYFQNELAAGTPFTQAGARELFRLGILTICISLGCSIVAEIVGGIMAGFLQGDDLLEIENIDSVSLGVVFLVMSVLCRCGAELQAQMRE